VTGDEVAKLLDLAPHPEGGRFRETFRDAGSTAIYFLLAANEVSRWHRVDKAEAWHWYAGAPLELRIGRDGHRLGSDLAAGERPQIVVPAGEWQSAYSLGAWTLVGCTVAPPFDFSGFELAPRGWAPPG
jgi:predicted cupin superfamily sugar epimerase